MKPVKSTKQWAKNLLCLFLCSASFATAQTNDSTEAAPNLEPDSSAKPELVEKESKPSAKADETTEVAKVPEEPKAEESGGIDKAINDAMGPLTKWTFKFIFAGPELENSDGEALTYANGEKMTLPLILIWLVGAALILTFIFRFINISSLKLAFRTVKGKYSKKDDPGEITHFQALTAALSGTVGLGNIAGVAIAISVGGAGAVFWMVLAGFLGMTTKFCECTLGVKYRKIDKQGRVKGGAMYYLRDGLKERGMGGLGKTLAVLFAIMCIGASFGGGNMFQVNQACTQFIGITETQEHRDAKTEHKALAEKKKSYDALVTKLSDQKKASETFRKELVKFEKERGTSSAALVAQLKNTETEIASLDKKVGKKSEKMTAFAASEKELLAKVESTKGFFAKERWVFGLVIASIVGVVIIGGIRSIAKVTEFLVPIMCGIYIIAAFVVLAKFANKIPESIGVIFASAFGVKAMAGGMIGAFIQGIRRAAFSNEAGFGSAPIAHSAVKTRHPASEGLVALLEPFVDTIVVCTMTGLVIVITGMHEPGNGEGLGGIELTSASFAQVISFFPYILTASVILFAFSTMISWSYYGQQAWGYLFGSSKMVEVIYKLIFCLFIVLGSAMSIGNVLDFSDGMLFAMCLFNLIGVWILFPVVKDELKIFRKHAADIDSKS